MKTSFFFAIAAMAISTVMAACTKNESGIEQAETESAALEIVEAGIRQNTTRSGITATSFTGSESIGVFLNAGTFGTQYASGGNTNIKYSLSAGKWSSAAPIYLNRTAGVVYAYYPYSVAYTGNGSNVPITVADNQGTGVSTGSTDSAEQADYMYASSVSNVSVTNATVALKMNHVLSMLSFAFENSATDRYPAAGRVTKITVKNASANQAIKSGSGTMNISTGAVALTTASALGISISPAAATQFGAATASQPRMLVAPATIAAKGATFIIVIDGITYTVDVPAVTYEAGKKYNYTFTLSGKGLAVSAVSVTAWTDVDVEGISLL